MNHKALIPYGIVVGYWFYHPCDDQPYMHEAWVYGPNGRIGWWIPDVG